MTMIKVHMNQTMSITLRFIGGTVPVMARENSHGPFVFVVDVISLFYGFMGFITTSLFLLCLWYILLHKIITPITGHIL